MRAQAAISEALIAATLLAAAVSFASSTYPTALSVYSIKRLELQDSVFDIQRALQGNATYGACVLSGDAACQNSFLSIFASAYGLNYVSLSQANGTVSYGSAQRCTTSEAECFPLSHNGTVSAVCVSVCGD